MEFPGSTVWRRPGEAGKKIVFSDQQRSLGWSG
jgi:hypothetical protein